MPSSGSQAAHGAPDSAGQPAVAAQAVPGAAKAAATANNSTTSSPRRAPHTKRMTGAYKPWQARQGPESRCGC